MTISYIGASSTLAGDNLDTVLAIGLPTRAAGDVLLAFPGNKWDSGTSGEPDTVSGWSKDATVQSGTAAATAGGEGNVRMTGYSRTATNNASDALTVTWPVIYEPAVGRMIALRGSTGTPTLEATQGADTNQTGTAISITAVSAFDLVVGDWLAVGIMSPEDGSGAMGSISLTVANVTLSVTTRFAEVSALGQDCSYTIVTAAVTNVAGTPGAPVFTATTASGDSDAAAVFYRLTEDTGGTTFEEHPATSAQAAQAVAAAQVHRNTPVATASTAQATTASLTATEAPTASAQATATVADLQYHTHTESVAATGVAATAADAVQTAVEAPLTSAPASTVATETLTPAESPVAVASAATASSSTQQAVEAPSASAQAATAALHLHTAVEHPLATTAATATVADNLAGTTEEHPVATAQASTAVADSQHAADSPVASAEVASHVAAAQVHTASLGASATAHTAASDQITSVVFESVLATTQASATLAELAFLTERARTTAWGTAGAVSVLAMVESPLALGLASTTASDSSPDDGAPVVGATVRYGPSHGVIWDPGPADVVVQGAPAKVQLGGGSTEAT